MKRFLLGIAAAGVLGFFIAAAVANDKAPQSDPVVEATDEGCLADSATLEDLKRQKRDLETRTRGLEARELDLKAREKALSEQLKQISEAREEVVKLDGEKKKVDETRVTKLIETLETMNPKAASALLGSIDDSLAVTAMTRLSTSKLAKVMNVMEPARSTKLSELLAGVTRAKKNLTGVTTERLSAATNSMKGGERENAKNNESSVRTDAGIGSNASPGKSEQREKTNRSTQ